MIDITEESKWISFSSIKASFSMKSQSINVSDLKSTCSLCAPGYDLNNSTGICERNVSCPSSNMYFDTIEDRCLSCS